MLGEDVGELDAREGRGVWRAFGFYFGFQLFLLPFDLPNLLLNLLSYSFCRLVRVPYV